MKSPRLAVMLAILGGALMLAVGLGKPSEAVADGMRWGSLLLIGAAMLLGAPGTSRSAPVPVRLGVGLIGAIAVVTVIEVMRPEGGFGFDTLIGGVTLVVSTVVLLARIAGSRERGEAGRRSQPRGRRSAGARSSRNNY